MAAACPTDVPIAVIERSPRWRFVDFRELWRYRELLVSLARRDIQVRYKQTLFGAAWALVQPLAPMAAFALFLGGVAGQSGDTPYALFVFAGLLPWTLFAATVSAASQSLLVNPNLV